LKYFKRLLRVTGQAIYPETVELKCTYVHLIDPYGVFPKGVVNQDDNVVGGHFARAPGSVELTSAPCRTLLRRYGGGLIVGKRLRVALFDTASKATFVFSAQNSEDQG
jgi:hypothetical protein